MRVLVIGATGMIGSRVAAEALSRGHRVTALTRSGNAPEGAASVQGDASDPAVVTTAAMGQEAVVAAVRVPGDTPEPLLATGRAILAGAARAGVRRVVIVGGSGSLEIAPGRRVLDDPDFPEVWKPEALNHAAFLDLVRGEGGDLEWTYISPAGVIAPGDRTGNYRRGGDRLLTDPEGNSNISAEDFAVALLDELESPKALRQRITFAY